MLLQEHDPTINAPFARYFMVSESLRFDECDVALCFMTRSLIAPRAHEDSSEQNGQVLLVAFVGLLSQGTLCAVLQ